MLNGRCIRRAPPANEDVQRPQVLLEKLPVHVFGEQVGWAFGSGYFREGEFLEPGLLVPRALQPRGGVSCPNRGADTPQWPPSRRS